MSKHSETPIENYDENYSDNPRMNFVSGKTKAAVALVCAASILGIPFLAMAGANTSEETKIAEADVAEAVVVQEVVEEVIEEEKTEKADLSEQLLCNLEINTVGLADTATLGALQEEIAEETKETEVSEEELREYAIGTRNKNVAKIQQRLMELNYMEEDEPTSYYGKMTSEAITYFQRKNSLKMTGVADSKTLDLLFSDNAKKYMVSEGDRGNDVKSMQERLRELGYSVSATGYFGPETKSAVKAFQQKNGLEADGRIGSNTKEALYSSKAVKATDTKAKSETKQSQAKTEDKKSDDKKTDTKKNDDNKSEEKKTETSNERKGDSSGVGHANSSKVEAFISAAESLLGKPYVLGGKGPDEFDCSGFVYYALNQSGFKMSYMTSGGWASCGYAEIYGMKNLERGDVICFKGHVGICLGGDSMIDASSADGKIRKCYNISSNSYWKSHFICGKRPLL